MALPDVVYRRQHTTAHGSLDALTSTEWLLTNGLGGFAMGTASGVPTRRYHGLLIASLRPPVNRVLALAQFAEQVIIPGGERVDLGSFRFRPDTIHPDGHRRLTSFEKDLSAHWRFSVGAISILKTVHIVRESPSVMVRYRFSNGHASPAKIILRPLVAMRDFHSLQLRDLSWEKYACSPTERGVVVNAKGVGTLRLQADAGSFVPDEHWWCNLQYTTEQARGYDSLEDLFIPGVFECMIPPGESSLTIAASIGELPSVRIEEAEAHGRKRLAAIYDATRVTLGPAFAPRGPMNTHPILRQLPGLIAAADDFVVHRVRPGALPGAPADRVSIIAGYPWFADWGRDSMIALPGLLLTCGRLSEAREVLRTFAGACHEGLIPNVFDDYTGQAHYNTVDASLWFVHAACQYLIESGDEDAFAADLLPACTEIITRYQKGTRFNIRMDEIDGLIAAGDESTQLTWMDAKRDGVVFTPRHGKAIEINALWYNALRSLAVACEHIRPEFASACAMLAPVVGRSIRSRFWNSRRGCLFDVIAADGSGAEELRPNQLLAVSLPYSALEVEQQQAVVKAVRSVLYTPHGVRTLEPGDWRYRGRFRGRMFDRDASYHNGTAWPWLLGPLAEATCRAGQFKPGALTQARAILDGALRSLDSDCCGQIAEVYDGDDTGDEPQASGGCPAQAWSVAELLRVLVVIARAEAAG